MSESKEDRNNGIVSSVASPISEKVVLRFPTSLCSLEVSLDGKGGKRSLISEGGSVCSAPWGGWRPFKQSASKLGQVSWSSDDSLEECVARRASAFAKLLNQPGTTKLQCARSTTYLIWRPMFPKPAWMHRSSSLSCSYTGGQVFCIGNMTVESRHI